MQSVIGIDVSKEKLARRLLKIQYPDSNPFTSGFSKTTSTILTFAWNQPAVRC